jgi:murein L,D-transpeptidase YcbB/YkuD
VLSGDSVWNDRKLEEERKKGKEQFVPLKRPVPVSIVYFTTWVDEEGILQEREDVYGHDRRLAELLFNIPVSVYRDTSVAAE